MHPPALDIARHIETPEGVELQLHSAGPVVRALAWSIDVLIRGAFYLLLFIALQSFKQLGAALMALFVFFIEWWYPVVFEVRYGRTPGKRAMGLRVMQDNGAPVTWQASLIRNLLWVVDFAPMFYGFGLTSMLLNDHFKRLGDLAAGTVVVYAEQAQRPVHWPDVAALMPPVTLAREDQRALLDFAERGPLLSEERRAELANLLGNVALARDAAAVHRLQQYAAWLAGTQEPSAAPNPPAPGATP